MSPEEEVVRAGEAAQILNSRMFQEAKAKIEASLADQRHVVPIRDTEMHTRLILTEQLWARLLAFFQETADTGRLAQLQIRDKNARDKVKGLFGQLRG